MSDPGTFSRPLIERFSTEIENFVDIFRLLQPPTPELRVGEMEVYGKSLFLSGSAGGDHIIYVDFDTRFDLQRRILIAREQGQTSVASELEENRQRLGILLSDVSGHSITDALISAMLHQAFLTGILYELDRYGGVTTRLFENLNSRFFNSVSVGKFITLIYGEVSDHGTFRFLSAGHPEPLVFSAEFDSFVTISPDRLTSFFPMGMFPSADHVDVSRNPGAMRYKEKYSVNEVNLMGTGDILLLYTDGLAEHGGDNCYVPGPLEERLRQVKAGSAQEIFDAICADMLTFGDPQDDVSLVVIKKG